MLTFDQWGQQVRELLPDFGTVAVKYSLFLNTEAAERLLDVGEYLTVFAMLQGFCEGLQIDPSAALEHAQLCDILKSYPHEESH